MHKNIVKKINEVRKTDKLQRGPAVMYFSCHVTNEGAHYAKHKGDARKQRCRDFTFLYACLTNKTEASSESDSTVNFDDEDLYLEVGRLLKHLIVDFH